MLIQPYIQRCIGLKFRARYSHNIQLKFSNRLVCSLLQKYITNVIYFLRTLTTGMCFQLRAILQLHQSVQPYLINNQVNWMWICSYSQGSLKCLNFDFSHYHIDVPLLGRAFKRKHIPDKGFSMCNCIKVCSLV